MTVMLSLHHEIEESEDKIPASQEDAGGFSVRARCQRESAFDIC